MRRAASRRRAVARGAGPPAARRGHALRSLAAVHGGNPRTITALTQLLLFQFAGEATARGLDLTVPGPVLGMLQLFAFLQGRCGPGSDLRATSESLLFVPAGTGISVHPHRVADEWRPLLVALVLSTLLITALVMRLCQAHASAPSHA